MNNIYIVYDSYIAIANLDALISGVDFHLDLITVRGIPPTKRPVGKTASGRKKAVTARAYGCYGAIVWWICEANAWDTVWSEAN